MKTNSSLANNPPPLEFLTKDYIAPANREVLQDEEWRYRPLKWFERWKLQIYVGRLRKELERAGYNDLIQRRDELLAQLRGLHEKYALAANEGEKETIVAKGRSVIKAGKQITAQLEELSEDYQRYDHYRRFLDYEQKNRKELIQRERKEKRIRREMEREAKWIEQAILDVWRKAPGCHYIDDNDKNHVPTFFLSEIKPDAHWFWLRTRRKLPIIGYKFLLPAGVTVSNLYDDEVIENLRAATGRQVSVHWTDQNQVLFKVSRKDSPDSLPKMVLWRDTREFYPQERHERLPYCIGAREERRLEWLDLASHPHLLVAGMTQSGKSVLVNGIIATLASHFSPSELRFILVDQKKMEFIHWENLAHTLGEVVTTLEGVEPLFLRLNTILDHRESLLQNARAKELNTYNRRVDQSNRLPRLIIVFDELQNIVGLGGKTEELHNLIWRIAARGRAVGMHLILCTQHPEVKVVPGRIKTNMPVRLAGAMPNRTASEIVLDNDDATLIPDDVPGRFAAKVLMKRLMVQAPYIEDSDISMIVSSSNVNYPDTPLDLPELTTKNTPVIKTWAEDDTLEAALDLLDGKLSAQELHKMLGDDSPGEWHFKRMIASIQERMETNGGMITVRGRAYTIKPQGRAKYLKPLGRSERSERSEELEAQASETVNSDQASDQEVKPAIV